MSDDSACPVCDREYNHEVRNGHRNRWPKGVDFEVCTPSDNDHMFVHTEGDSPELHDPYGVEEFVGGEEA